MRIVIDLTSLADNFSGIERYALNMTKSLIEKERSNEFILIFKREVHKDFIEFNSSSNIQTVILNGFRNKLLFQQFTLLRALTSIKADVYLFFAFPSPLLFFGKTTYFTMHDLTCYMYPETMKKAAEIFYKVSYKKAMLNKENLITISETVKNEIQDYFNYKKKIIVCPCGISENFLTCKADDLLDLENINSRFNFEGSYFLAVGTLEPRKNFLKLLEAYVNLALSDSSIPNLLIVGRKGWKIGEYLSQKIDVEVEEKIIFTGFVDDNLLVSLYRNADSFIFPSLYEGFGIPLLESASQNTLVMCSDIPVFHEIMNNGALYFNPESVQSISDVINKSITSSIDAELYVNEAKKVVEFYNWSESINNLVIDLKRSSIDETN